MTVKDAWIEAQVEKGIPRPVAVQKSKLISAVRPGSDEPMSKQIPPGLEREIINLWIKMCNRIEEGDMGAASRCGVEMAQIVR